MGELNTEQKEILRYLYEHRNENAPGIDRIAEAVGLAPAVVKKCMTELKELGLVSGPPSLLERTSAALKEIDENLNPISESYAETIILLASIFTRADEAFLSEELGYDATFVGTVGSRLRAAGIWRGDKIAPERAIKYDHDGLSFWLDAAVAAGTLKIVSGSDGEPRYQMTEDGRSIVSRLGAKDPGHGG